MNIALTIWFRGIAVGTATSDVCTLLITPKESSSRLKLGSMYALECLIALRNFLFTISFLCEGEGRAD